MLSWLPRGEGVCSTNPPFVAYPTLSLVNHLMRVDNDSTYFIAQCGSGAINITEDNTLVLFRIHSLVYCAFNPFRVCRPVVPSVLLSL